MSPFHLCCHGNCSASPLLEGLCEEKEPTWQPAAVRTRQKHKRAAEISLRFVFGIFIEMMLDIVKQQSKKQSVEAHDVLAVYTDYLQNTKNIQNFA